MPNKSILNESECMQVLLVDDDLDVLAANARFLRVNDIDVVLAESVSTALLRLAELDIDVIVTDLRMPKTNGLDFARQARETRPLIPIVFFSGFAQVPDVVAAMKLGAVEFLEKPVDPDELLSVIRSVQQSHYGSLVNQRQVFDGCDQGHPLKMRVLAYEKYLIESSLLKHDGNIASVLSSLHINRRTLNDKMSKLGIKRDALLEQQSGISPDEQS